MAASPKIEDVEKNITAWQTCYEKNNERGRTSIDFTTKGQQWSSTTRSARTSANKETLVLNQCIKYKNRAANQLRQIEFVMDVNPSNTPESQDRIDEYNAFKLFFKHLYNNPKQQGKYFEATNKCLDYGYSVVEVKNVREDQKTLNQIPDIKVGQDPSSYFFDPCARHPCKWDGDFSGYKNKVSRSFIEQNYPEICNKDYVKDENIWIVYYYRRYIKVSYTLMKTGVYKRSDLLTPDEIKDSIRRGSDTLPIVQKDYISEIYMQQYCNKSKVGKPIKWPTDDLPLVYNHALTTWTDDGVCTYPYTYYLQDAQKLHNFVMSQVATTVKNSTSAKYFFRPDHIQNETQKTDAKNINQIEGGVAVGYDKEVPFPQKVPADEIPQTLLALSQQSNQQIESISGAAFEMQPSENVSVSGVAVREITHNIQMMNSGIVASNIEFINSICMLQTQMLPRIVTEERLLCVKDDNGKMIDVCINKKEKAIVKDQEGHVVMGVNGYPEEVETGKILNNIKDIEDRFYYEIKASPTTQMQNDNTIKTLEVIFRASPQTVPLLADIFVKCTDSPYADEMARRLQANMDPDLLSLSNGEISEQEFKQRQQEKKQAAMQNQQQQMDKQLAAEKEASDKLAAAEQTKGDAAMVKAQNEKERNDMEAIEKQVNASINVFKAKTDAGIAQEEIDLQKAKAGIEELRSLVDIISKRVGGNASG